MCICLYAIAMLHCVWFEFSELFSDDYSLIIVTCELIGEQRLLAWQNLNWFRFKVIKFIVNLEFHHNEVAFVCSDVAHSKHKQRESRRCLSSSPISGKPLCYCCFSLTLNVKTEKKNFFNFPNGYRSATLNKGKCICMRGEGKSQNKCLKAARVRWMKLGVVVPPRTIWLLYSFSKVNYRWFLKSICRTFYIFPSWKAFHVTSKERVFPSNK
jgi:hypothetical protein